jgi:hypothetical protein
MQLFTSSGTWMRPLDVTTVWVKVIGGGGGGGRHDEVTVDHNEGSTIVFVPGNRGGAGAYGEAIVPVSGDVTIIVGQGGAPPPDCSLAADGGDSSFEGNVIVVARGGKGGASACGGPGGGGDAGTCTGATICARADSGAAYGYGSKGESDSQGGPGAVIVYW